MSFKVSSGRRDEISINEINNLNNWLLSNHIVIKSIQHYEFQVGIIVITVVWVIVISLHAVPCHLLTIKWDWDIPYHLTKIWWVILVTVTLRVLWVWQAVPSLHSQSDPVAPGGSGGQCTVTRCESKFDVI